MKKHRSCFSPHLFHQSLCTEVLWLLSAHVFAAIASHLLGSIQAFVYKHIHALGNWCSCTATDNCKYLSQMLPYKLPHCYYLSKGILCFFVIATPSKPSRDMFSKNSWETSSESSLYSDTFVIRNMLQTHKTKLSDVVQCILKSISIYISRHQTNVFCHMT